MNTITPAQRVAILQLWAQVCKDRGWKPSDRNLRLTEIGRLLGRELTSLDEVERLAECTKVMAELKALLGVSLRAGLEATDPSRNRKRNWRWLIAHEALPCLGLYEANPQGYLMTVMLGKSRWRKTDRPESDPALTDFDERTVEQIFWTLNARVQAKRKAAGQSGHEMCLAAGVRCKCAACKRAAEAGDIENHFAGTGKMVEGVAAAAEDPDWRV
jgi:hypothetical protein